MALIQDYLELSLKYQQEYGTHTILLMQVGSFFEVYGDKTHRMIDEFCSICDLNIADKGSCQMAGFKDFQLEKYLNRLQENGYTVVVYAQENDNVKVRSLVGIFSPGSYFSADSKQITNNTTAIWINVIDVKSSPILSKTMPISKMYSGKIVQVGLANIDIYTGKTSIFEFKETYLDASTTFDELERFISIYRPSEVLIIGNILEDSMDKILNYANVDCNSIHKISLLRENGTETLKRALNSEKQIYQKELFSRFYHITDYSIFSQNFYNNEIATQAFCFLLDFIYQHNPNLTNKISEPIFENCSDRLILANHSLKQLNIIDDKKEEKRGKIASVEKLLNMCVTSMGKRRFSHYFLNPTTDIQYLKGEYNMTEYMLTHFDKYSSLQNKLQNIKDIEKLNRQIIIKKVSPKMLYQFYKNLFVIEEIIALVEDDAMLLNYLKTDKLEITKCCCSLVEFFETRMDMTICEDIDTIQQFDVNFFKRGVDVVLDEKDKVLLESMDKLEAIRAYLNGIICKYEKAGKNKSISADYIKIHETEKNNFRMLSTKRRCALLKQSIPSLEESVSLKYKSSYNSEECVFEFKISRDLLDIQKHTASNDTINMPIINDVCKNISANKMQMKDMLNNVYFKSIVAALEDKRETFKCITEFITMLDFIYAKAAIARKFNYCKPEIVESESCKSFVNAKNLRHCLIEHIQQNEIYVTNDIVLGVNTDGVLLYGTNAVGKTSFIRAIGVAVVMAQAGLYVPCSQFQFWPYKYIFTRILGNDDIHKGLSTFAVEMSELRTILRLADKNSLILGDELCSGTESISARSIFVAGIQMLSAKESCYIFATHMHEILDYEEVVDLKTLSIKHMEVRYDKERDLLIYDRKLKEGPGDNMYGLEVCKSLSLPSDFLDLANNIRMKYKEDASSILSLNTSHFNSRKIVALCEICGKQRGKEVHHLQHQQDANEDGIIVAEDGSVFHKNHIANLMSLCEKCHQDIHKKEKDTKKDKEKDKEKKKRVVKKIKTSNGLMVNIF